MGISQQYYKKAKKLIPGGTQLLSKRPELFLPDLWPAYYSRAEGCEIWDLDNRRYLDMSYMGIGSCILGYADKEVDNAVKKAIDKGSMATLNCPEEVGLAELLLEIHPWAQMVRYARTGGEAMTVAVRIARAFTKKDIILFCGYHGWHDWYLAANLSSDRALDGHLLAGLNPLGVPRKLIGTAYPFNYNDITGFLSLALKYKGKIGGIVLESVRNDLPEKEFMSTIMQAAKEQNIALVVDEVTAGFRLNIGGAHLLLGLEPDIAVFAKGISNGFPMAAIIGKRKVMEVAQDTFISSTYWTDRIGPTAAITTIQKIRKFDVPKYLIKIGQEVRAGWKTLALEHKIDIVVGGIDPLLHFVFKAKSPLVLKTLFTQLMLERGFLATTAFYASYAHRTKDIKRYLEAVDKAFAFIKKAISNRKPERYLKGPVCHSGFKRLV